MRFPFHKSMLPIPGHLLVPHVFGKCFQEYFLCHSPMLDHGPGSRFSVSRAVDGPSYQLTAFRSWDRVPCQEVMTWTGFIPIFQPVLSYAAAGPYYSLATFIHYITAVLWAIPLWLCDSNEITVQQLHADLHPLPPVFPPCGVHQNI